MTHIERGLIATALLCGGLLMVIIGVEPAHNPKLIIPGLAASLIGASIFPLKGYRGRRWRNED